MPQGWNIDMICLGFNYLNIPLNIYIFKCHSHSQSQTHTTSEIEVNWACVTLAWINQVISSHL